MSDLVPAVAGGSTPSVLTPLTDPALGGASARLRAFMGQTSVRRALPWFAGMSAAGLAGVLWMTMAPAPQRMLYSQLSDNERAQVVAALDKASIPTRSTIRPARSPCRKAIFTRPAWSLPRTARSPRPKPGSR
jgi:flagellar M-ring protein FliF